MNDEELVEDLLEVELGPAPVQRSGLGSVSYPRQPSVRARDELHRHGYSLHTSSRPTGTQIPDSLARRSAAISVERESVSDNSTDSENSSPRLGPPYTQKTPPRASGWLQDEYSTPTQPRQHPGPAQWNPADQMASLTVTMSQSSLVQLPPPTQTHSTASQPMLSGPHLSAAMASGQDSVPGKQSSRGPCCKTLNRTVVISSSAKARSPTIVASSRYSDYNDRKEGTDRNNQSGPECATVS